jgi:hypothetical protein
MESRRISIQQFQEGTVLRLQPHTVAAQKLDARTLLPQSQLDYIQERDEMTEAMGRTPGWSDKSFDCQALPKRVRFPSPGLSGTIPNSAIECGCSRF